VFLLLAAPAEAVQITDLRLNCAGVDIFGGTVHNVSCQGEGLFLDAVVRGFPVATAPVVRFALALDGVEIASDTRTLQADLGPIFGSNTGEHYTAEGMGWRLPLDSICNPGCTGGRARWWVECLWVPYQPPDGRVPLPSRTCLRLLKAHHRPDQFPMTRGLRLSVEAEAAEVPRGRARVGAEGLG